MKLTLSILPCFHSVFQEQSHDAGVAVSRGFPSAVNQTTSISLKMTKARLRGEDATVVCYIFYTVQPRIQLQSDSRSQSRGACLHQPLRGGSRSPHDPGMMPQPAHYHACALGHQGVPDRDAEAAATTTPLRKPGRFWPRSQSAPPCTKKPETLPLRLALTKGALLGCLGLGHRCPRESEAVCVLRAPACIRTTVPPLRAGRHRRAAV